MFVKAVPAIPIKTLVGKDAWIIQENATTESPKKTVLGAVKAIQIAPGTSAIEGSAAPIPFGVDHAILIETLVKKDAWIITATAATQIL
jgi:hypothetical protein